MLKKPLITLPLIGSVANILGYRFVRRGTADNLVSTAISAVGVVGVSTEVGIDIGRVGDVVIAGIYPVRAGAAVPMGSRLTSDATGRAIVDPAGTLGVAYSSATAANDLIFVLLK